jgi:hypothetical protein
MTTPWRSVQDAEKANDATAPAKRHGRREQLDVIAVRKFALGTCRNLNHSQPTCSGLIGNLADSGECVRTELIFADVFVPDFGMILDVAGQ